jgi:hypothetical protein
MSQETSSSLCRVSECVESMRRRQTIAFWVLFCVLVVLFLWLGQMSRNPAAEVREIVLFAVFVLFFAMVYVAMALALVQSKMILMVLKSVELLSRR